jgi:hypothetical protein
MEICLNVNVVILDSIVLALRLSCLGYLWMSDGIVFLNKNHNYIIY